MTGKVGKQQIIKILYANYTYYTYYSLQEATKDYFDINRLNQIWT